MYDNRHGGPFDRGGADYYYGRSYESHYYVGDTYSSERVELANMTAQQIVEYTAGYNAGTCHSPALQRYAAAFF